MIKCSNKKIEIEGKTIDILTEYTILTAKLYQEIRKRRNRNSSDTRKINGGEK